jgi:hypothetical protein
VRDAHASLMLFFSRRTVCTRFGLNFIYQRFYCATAHKHQICDQSSNFVTAFMTFLTNVTISSQFCVKDSIKVFDAKQPQSRKMSFGRYSSKKN